MRNPLIEQGFPDIAVFCACVGVHTGRCAGHWASVTPGRVEGKLLVLQVPENQEHGVLIILPALFHLYPLLTKSSLEGNSLLLIFNFLVLL